MPRLVSVFSIPDLGWLEEELFYVAGFPVRVRLVLGGLAGLVLLMAGAPWEAAAATSLAGLALGAAPLRPPPAKLLARREPAEGEPVYWAPLGSILVYVNVPEAGELVVLVDGREHDKLSVDGGLVRIEVSGLAPGEHTIRVVAGERVLRELRVFSGERRVQPIKVKAEAEAKTRKEA